MQQCVFQGNTLRRRLFSHLEEGTDPILQQPAFGLYGNTRTTSVPRCNSLPTTVYYASEKEHDVPGFQNLDNKAQCPQDRVESMLMVAYRFSARHSVFWSCTTLSALSILQLLSSLDNPNIIAYKESFMDKDQSLCIVTYFCEEGDLFNKIKARAATQQYFNEDDIMDIFIQARQNCIIASHTPRHTMVIVHDGMPPSLPMRLDA